MSVRGGRGRGRGSSGGQGKGRGRGKSRKDDLEDDSLPLNPTSGQPFTLCERSFKLKRSDFEGFKGTEDEDDDVEFLESRLPFSVDRPISLIGIKFASELYQNPKDVDISPRNKKNSYDEEAFIYLMDGSQELAETHIDDEVPYKSLIEARFEKPVSLVAEKVYKIKLLCNVDGAYPLAECSSVEIKDGVTFRFDVGSAEDCIRDGIIRAFLFKKE